MSPNSRKEQRASSCVLNLILVALILVSGGCLSPRQLKVNNLYGAGHYNEVVTIMEGDLAKGEEAGTTDLFYLCGAYAQVKQYNKLFPCLDRLESRIRMGERSIIQGFDVSPMPTLLRGQAYLELGNYQKAVQEAVKSYDIVIERDSRRQIKIWSLSVVALAYALNGDRPNALKFVALLEDVGTHYPHNLMAKPKALGLGRTYLALGEYEKSLGALKGGWSVFEGLVPSLVRWQELPRQFMMHKCLYELGRIDEAKTGYQELLAQESTKENGEIYWLILFDLGRIAEAEKRPQEALKHYKGAITEIERQRSTINTMANKIGFVGDKQRVYARLVDVLVTQGHDTEAFEYVERAKSRALVDLLASQNTFVAQPAQQTAVKAMLDELETVELMNKAEDIDLASVSASSQRGVVVTQLKAKLQKDSPELASLVTVPTVSSAEIQRKLGSDETLVEYYYDDKQGLAFLLTKDHLKAVRFDPVNMADDVDRLRRSIGDPKNQAYEAIARALNQRLIVPIEKEIRTPHIVIVPHGSLHYLPFNVLTGESGALIDRWSLRYLPSASVVLYLERAAPSSNRNALLAFGNPTLGQPELQLRYAEQEAIQIGQAFPQSKVLVKNEATETSFKNLAPSYRYLHLATHGTFDSSKPLTSGLAMARDTENDGLLTVQELFTLRLSASLVTLSACETGLGKIGHGDDVIGMSRGFIYAGADSVLASLWPVDDEATLYLMLEFYEGLRKNSSKVDALRAAQRSVRKRYPHPFYWAAFQLTGMAL